MTRLTFAQYTFLAAAGGLNDEDIDDIVERLRPLVPEGPTGTLRACRELAHGNDGRPEPAAVDEVDA